MKLIVKRKRVYGAIRNYVMDSKVETALVLLTGNKTLTDEQVAALSALGFNVEVLNLVD
jgi:hypothetical protein